MSDAQPAGPGVSWRERHVPPRHAEVWVKIAGTWRPGLITYWVTDPGKPGWECAITAEESPGGPPWQGRYVYDPLTARNLIRAQPRLVGQSRWPGPFGPCPQQRSAPARGIRKE